MNMKAFLVHNCVDKDTNYGVILEQSMLRAVELLKGEITQYGSVQNPTVLVYLSQEAILSSGMPSLIENWHGARSCQVALQEMPLVTSYPLP
ncbi:MAG: hypothetical protein U1A23_03650 [Candidatus Sungbacteria bacterium]|nr:hypothetical protein [bacterium]MDZ4285996.1 hypothetical protein [Candidatus Sungbacteria bacterium]